MATEEISKPPPLPPYPKMIMEALDALKQKDGANKSAISNYIESKYGELPAGHANLLSAHLVTMKNNGELLLNRNNYLRPGSDVPPRRGRGRPPKPKTPEGSALSRGHPRTDPNVLPTPKKLKTAADPPSVLKIGRPRGRPRKVQPQPQPQPQQPPQNGLEDTMINDYMLCKEVKQEMTVESESSDGPTEDSGNVHRIPRPRSVVPRKHGGGKSPRVLAILKNSTDEEDADPVINLVSDDEVEPGTDRERENPCGHSMGDTAVQEKYIPNWQIRSSDSMIDSSHTASAVFHGLNLEGDIQRMENWEMNSTMQSFYHDLGKMAMKGRYLEKAMAHQSKLVLHGEEKILRYEEDIEVLRREKEKADKKIASLLLEKRTLVLRLSELQKDAESRISGAVSGYKESQAYLQDLVDSSIKFYMKGFEDCKKQLQKKKGGNWDFLHAQQFGGDGSDEEEMSGPGDI